MKTGLNIFTIVFWIAVVFYLDPGGFMTSSTEGDVDSVKSLAIKVGLLAILWAIWILIYDRNENRIITDNFLNRYTLIIVIWSVYYFLWYYGINSSSNVSPLKLITRNNRMWGQLLLVYPIVYFASIRLDQFVKILTISTIIISILFLLTVYAKIPFMEYIIMDRGMGTGLNRYLMVRYGIIYFSLPLSLCVLLMKYKGKGMIILSGVLVLLLIIAAIFRRDMVGFIEFLLIIGFMVNYINNAKMINFIWRFITPRTVIFSVLTIIIIGFSFPKFVDSFGEMVDNTYRTAILGERSVTGGEDVRMSLTAQYGIVNAIKDNFLLGTGYDPLWSSGSGGVKGYEGSDYIFLAAFGMYGLVGLLIFLPFYILVIKIILKLLKLLRANIELVNQNKNVFFYPIIVGIAASSEFIKNIIEYPNWFFPIGAIYTSPKFFIYFALLLGSYYQIKKQIHIFQMKPYRE